MTNLKMNFYKLFVLAIICCIHFSPIAAQSNAVTIEEGLYFFVSKLAEDRVIDVSNGSREDRANIQLWEKNETTAQMFYIQSAGNNTYKIVNAKSNKCLTVEGNSASGSNIWQMADQSNSTQKFYFERSENGYYKIFPSSGNGVYLDVDNGNSNAGTNIKVWNSSDHDAQKFRLEPVDLRGTYEITMRITHLYATSDDACANVGSAMNWYGHIDIEGDSKKFDVVDEVNVNAQWVHSVIVENTNGRNFRSFRVTARIKDEDDAFCGGGDDVVKVHPIRNTENLEVMINYPRGSVQYAQSSAYVASSHLGYTGKSITTQGANYNNPDYETANMSFTIDIKKVPNPQWNNLGGELTSDPTAVSMRPNWLNVFARGKDGAVWNKYWDGSRWSEWESLGGQIPADAKISAVSWANNRIDLFVRGTDNAIWHQAWNGNNWSGWNSLGGELTSDPTAVSMRPNWLNVFARGKDGAVWNKYWDGSRWSEWESLGGQVPADAKISAVSWANNRIDLFVRGTDNAIWHQAWNGNNWSGWNSLGGELTSEPTAVSMRPNWLNVFARGKDGAVWNKYWDGNRWSEWESLGGQIPADAKISAVSWANNRIDLFARGTDNAIWHQAWNGNNWSGWNSLGGETTTNPDAISWGSNRLDVFAKGANSAINHMFWDGNKWGY